MFLAGPSSPGEGNPALPFGFSLLLPLLGRGNLQLFPLGTPRHRIGMDPSLPPQLLLGDEDLAPPGGSGGFNSSSHRFHHILHLSISSGEQEKLAQVRAAKGGAGAELSREAQNPSEVGPTHPHPSRASLRTS